ncbi:MAG: methyl-accepting chemotaxis protein [Pseudomonadota bacterium]
MNIKFTLLSGVTILALIISGFNGYELYEAWNERQVFLTSQKSSKTKTLLLKAANHWAVERGASNYALNTTNIPSQSVKNIVIENRLAGNSAYLEALKQIDDYQFPQKNSLLTKVKKHYSAIEKLRTQVDTNFKKNQIQRDPKLTKVLINEMSKMIMISQNLRYALVKKEALINPRLGLKSNLQHFAWILSEFAGRERAIIGGVISANLGLDESNVQTLSHYRGKVELAWTMIQKLNDGSYANFETALTKVDQTFFGPYEKLRQSVYSAGTDAETYPVNADKWFETSTTAIDSVLNFQNVITQEINAYAETLLAYSNRKLQFNAFVLLACLVIVAFTYYIVLYRVLRPLHNMTVAMGRMAEGKKAQIPSLNAKDEIGKIARALSGINDIGQSALRVQIALDNASSPVMLADLELNIAYVNQSLTSMFSSAEKDIRGELTSFETSKLCELSLSDLLKNTDLKASELKATKESFKKTLAIGNHIFDIIATPVLNSDGDRLGTVIEWQDVTNIRQLEEKEKAVLQDVQAAVTACANGDFSSRITTDGLDGFMLQLSNGMNSICEVSEKGLTEIRDTMQAISEGDLSQNISGTYSGMFDEIKNACNTTLSQLRTIIHDATEAAAEAGQGNFANKISLEGKQGFMLELAEGINSINEISDRGLNEIRMSVQAIAQGDLSKTIDGQYAGMFDEIKQAFNQTLKQLCLIIDEATDASSAAGRGDFSRTINTDGRDGFMLELAEGINSINQTSNNGLTEIRDSVMAIANGDLSRRIDGQYAGMFDEIKQAFNITLLQLNTIIGDATAVSQAAGRGDFSKQIDVNNKEGFMKELAEGINGINEVSYQGLTEVKNVIASVANGNLSIKMTNEYDGMFDDIKQALNNTIDKLNEITTQIRVAATDVSSASKEIAAGSYDLSNRTEKQASSLQSTAASMEEISATVQNNSLNADQANQLAISAKGSAGKGGEIVTNAVHAMARIEKSSRKISDITNVIDEIAFQINLLALNAAVEAARAGEAGKGFEVVAAEVRKLAQRSANAAKDIEQLIEESGNEVQQGAQLVKETGNSLESIVGSVTRLADIVGEIAAACREQSTGIEHINNSVTQMDTMTQQNSALVEENTAATQSLQERSTEMLDHISFFRVDHDTQSSSTAEGYESEPMLRQAIY